MPAPEKRSVARRLLWPLRWLFRRLSRFRVADLIWLVLLAAILMTWYRDHKELQTRLAIQTGNAGASWSVDQVLGQPNTLFAGDIPTAWAPKERDLGNEWVIVEFPREVDLAKVEIRETHNPGAVVRICSVNMMGRETEIWRGTDPIKPVAGMGASIIAPTKKLRTRRIKVYLDTTLAAGWNEIDAIAIHAPDGFIQWATGAWGSSAYGDNRKKPFWFWP